MLFSPKEDITITRCWDSNWEVLIQTSGHVDFWDGIGLRPNVQSKEYYASYITKNMLLITVHWVHSLIKNKFNHHSKILNKKVYWLKILEEALTYVNDNVSRNISKKLIEKSKKRNMWNIPSFQEPKPFDGIPLAKTQFLLHWIFSVPNFQPLNCNPYSFL